MHEIVKMVENLSDHLTRADEMVSTLFVAFRKLLQDGDNSSLPFGLPELAVQYDHFVEGDKGIAGLSSSLMISSINSTPSLPGSPRTSPAISTAAPSISLTSAG